MERSPGSRHGPQYIFEGSRVPVPMDAGLVGGVVLIGVVHGVLPDHGWPIAATYALNRSRKWLYGVAAGLILGVGHLVSSVALVAAYFWFARVAEFAEGPWLRYVAGTMLVLLGIHEYRQGGHGHVAGNHDHSDHRHHHSSDSHDPASPSHDHASTLHSGENHEHHEPRTGSHGGEGANDGGGGVLSGVRRRLPSGGGHRHLSDEHAERGLVALGLTALLLGFAHEEPIQILAICVGTERCLELMLVYSLAVIVAILVPTLLLIAGYERYREVVEAYTPYLPLLTAVVLVSMGLAFIAGIF